MSKLPDKITRFDVAQIKYGTRKQCQCQNPHYEIDKQNRLVTCTDCGAIVDPFEALFNISRYYERIDRYTEQMLEERRQIRDYHPRRLVIKELERHYNSKSNLVPTCPHCSRPFELDKLLVGHWVNRRFLAEENDNGNI